MVYRASALRGLAIAQMVFGCLMFIFGIGSVVAVNNWTSYVGFGIWFGIWVLVTGILGHQGAKDNSKPNDCLIGCFMGFSILGCVISGIMFICYCVALAYFNSVLTCRDFIFNYNSYNNEYTYCYSSSYRRNAAAGAGLGSCLLILAIVEFFVALSSSIYCCNAVCCGAPAVGSVTTNQQVVFTQAQTQPQTVSLNDETRVVFTQAQMQPQTVSLNDETRVVILQQPSQPAVARVSQGYAIPGQLPTVYIPPQTMQIHQQVHQSPYWAVPHGSNPVPPAYQSMAAPVHPQPAIQEQQRPPPYTNIQPGNVPPPPAFAPE